jgi:hypothetical protein
MEKQVENIQLKDDFKLIIKLFQSSVWPVQWVFSYI